MDAQKTVIITGAAGGLGSTVTKTFLEKGYKVIATVASEKSKNSLEVHNNLDIYAVDLGDEKQAEDFVTSAIAKYGKIDAVLLLAGGFAMGGVTATKGDDIKKQLSINFETAYYVARPLFEHMLENKMVVVGDDYTVDGNWWLQQKGENTTAKTFNDRLDIGILTLVQSHDKRKHKQEEALRFYLMDAFGVKGRLAAVDAILSGKETQVKGQFKNVSEFITKISALGLQGSFQYLTKEEYGIE